MTAAAVMEQDWLAARLGRITASKDFLDILRGNGSILLAQKLREIQQDYHDNTGEATAAMMHGNRMESMAQEAILRHMPDGSKAAGKEVIVHPDLPYVSASPDMINRRRHLIGEIKCPTKDSTWHKAAKEIDIGQLRKDWQVQVQAQLWVCRA